MDDPNIDHRRTLRDIQNARINTAGAYLWVNGLYVFAIGLRPHNDHIPIVRLGGHREEHETGWQCAMREVYEEANLHIKPVFPSTTYLSDWDHMQMELQEIPWPQTIDREPAPIVVVAHHQEHNTHLSLMYLAQAEGHPVPSSEVKGLLLLDEEEIHRLCNEQLTLDQYLRRGGKAILNAKFEPSLLLEPFAQLRLLSKLFRTRSAIKTQWDTTSGTINDGMLDLQI